ncbi:hypothetical protein Hypma_016238 [Hypsizygus marmoreus]|uniref:Crinkler (CRN) family protein n=1 Tax=Hypsizygus marmoreus TaxID=39966 RepID=A0A369J0A7_HYPMA|nr:hypothetical protein Hypma_016238 [Hypsizygus marmoreus]
MNKMQTPPQETNISIKPLHVLSPSNDVYNHGWRGDSSYFFTTQQVIREQNTFIRADPEVQVPQECMIISQPSTLIRVMFKTQGLLLRNEYRTILRDLIQFCIGEKTVFETDADDNKDWNNTTLNPFHAGLVHSQNSPGVTVMGHPGIGKTAFLIYILILRCLAGLETVYVNTPIDYIYFCEAGAYAVRDTGDDSPGSPPPFGPNTWILLDLEFQVPHFVRQTQAFVVAASCAQYTTQMPAPVSEHFGLKYYMKPWTLSELIQGRHLLFAFDTPTEADLECFCIIFPPSAQVAFIKAINAEPYHEMLEIAISNLTLPKLAHLTWTTDYPDDWLTHRIFTVAPGVTRDRCVADIATEYIYQRLSLYFEDEELALLYEVFIASPFSVTSGGYILKNVMFRVFCEGGEWKVDHVLEGCQSLAMRSSEDCASASTESQPYLRLGQGTSIFSIVPDALSQNDRNFEPLRLFMYSSDTTLRNLKSGYYESCGQGSGSWIYDAEKNSAVVLQAIVPEYDLAEETNRVDGLLRSLGVAVVGYFVVMPPNLDGLGREELLKKFPVVEGSPTFMLYVPTLKCRDSAFKVEEEEMQDVGWL